LQITIVYDISEKEDKHRLMEKGYIHLGRIGKGIVPLPIFIISCSTHLLKSITIREL